ncbi:unnamed protein product [Rotaria magnacalcarata]|uniref:PARG catalytic Macro domain-containing protein n=1 Tax=Rotaria magnacalcarata TaxID=392030 RepID=A0A815PXW8_9BILA|nr:unnamed protein product [Rotaria magnacalcarata]CAF1617486.1 unnamed protein product [Rotaria magnacalcarata]CAF1942976.1 unnamed protein product [Rotaria magnacalcarata]CAF3804231.1 unnamed protein product [Rotaria magnacalcarata]CAF3853727.1 unnamed protein product [Rotaria magnacalcarata]
MASHSRFTDDIWCTPAPGAPLIDLRTIDELRNEIFSSGYDELQQALFQAEEMKSKDLYEKYAPNFKDKNKQYIFKYINEIKGYSPSPSRSLLVTRWKPFLPDRTPDKLLPTSTKVTFQADAFKYESCGDNDSVEWYLNFANHDLFAYYSGPLLAQDELQVLECVELAALREFFVQTINTVGSYTTGSDKHTQKTVPTPILISNTERVIKIDTTKVYGNAFAKATERQLIQACEYLKKPQTVNLIAIEAPSHGRGLYTLDQVQYILTTCYVGFKAAEILARKTQRLNAANERSMSRGENTRLRTIIHTGWWGCGAYGNNRQMMILAQILAAYWTQVHEIIFHTQTNEHDSDIRAARETAEKLLQEKSVDRVLEEIVKLNLQWERSNNT